MTNTNLLRARIIEYGFTIKTIADAIGISHASMSAKLHNKVEFKASEINALCIILKITDKDAYFFVVKNSQIG